VQRCEEIFENNERDTMTPISRRQALAALSTLTCTGSVLAQPAFPSQPIKLIVPYPAGGATDALARMMAQKMQDSWQQTVVVENKPGAGGTIGANQVAKGLADG
jgi:tripartite-type tricarboxylate transporter receptor subunit TctC